MTDFMAQPKTSGPIKPPVPITLGSVLRGLPDQIRSDVIAEWRKRGGSVQAWDRAAKLALSEAIFSVENELEHKLAMTGAIAPSSPRFGTVRRLNAARNVLLDDLGENELAPGVAVWCRSTAREAS